MALLMDNPSDFLARELFIRTVLPGIAGEAPARIVELLEPREVPERAVLFEAGEASTRFYFVVSGEIVMDDPGQKEWRFGPRSIVGIIDATLDRPHARRARASRDTSLLVARSSDWFDLLEDDPELASGTTVSLARQIHAQWLALGPSIGEARPQEGIPPPAAPLELYEKLLALRDAQLLNAAGLQATASLAEVADELRFEAGELLFDVGASAGTLYLLVHGVVELSRQNPELTVIHNAGSVIGGPPALAHELNEYRARARAPSVVLRISDEDYSDQAETHPELIRATLAYLVSAREAFIRLHPPRAPQDAALEG
jgi:CRP/FNR family cyclic AMP-dependent transcriptional regulator